MKYGVIGPRDFKGKEYENAEHIEQSLAQFSDMTDLISGGSKGVEKFAEAWARKQSDIQFHIVPPNIKLHGQRSAFDIRNTEIISKSDAMIVFWDGSNPGMIETLAKIVLCGKTCHLLPVI